METIKIDLISAEKSSLKYKINRFPDGDIMFEFLEDLPLKNVEYIIISSIKNYNDIYIIKQIKQILDRHGIKTVDIHIPYLISARMDRLMGFNKAISLDITSEELESLNFRNVYLYDLHNPANLPTNFINITDIFEKLHTFIAYPDAGAVERNSDTSCDVYFEKIRKEDGSINLKSYITTGNISYNEITVVDDLCDGGATFIAIHSKLKELGFNKINIRLTHCIQEQGIRKLCDLYNSVEITNSYSNWEDLKIPNLIVLDINDFIWKNL